MAADGTSLPEGVEPVVHGCGEHFPAVRTEDGVDEAANRRVELFLFSAKVEPAPPGETSAAGSSEYPAWRQRTVREIPFSASDASTIDIVIELPVVEGHEPLANARYRLTAEDQVIEGVTDDAGKLQLATPVPTGATLEVWADGDEAPPITWELTVDELLGTDDRDGAQARLDNLALTTEDEEGLGTAEDPLDEALLAFQWDNEVQDSDPFGSPTQDALLKVYGA
jgi:hypothetical protein